MHPASGALTKIRGRILPVADLPALKSVGGYRLLRKLGAGGMSEVFLSYDEGRRLPVAVKVLPDELAKNSTFVDRFRREGEIGNLVDHPNLVRCFKAGRDSGGHYYLVLEYVKGQSAQGRLDRGGPLPLREATRVVLDIARALEELHHRQYVHRDVKPGNILIGQDGRAKLADLGVAKLLTDATELTTLDQGIGTPFYMPWEQTLNAGLVDRRSDLFALGATYYHLVTGRVPFPGTRVEEVARLKDDGEYTSARALDPSLPATLDSILAKLMARTPGERFQTAAELIDALTASGLAIDAVAASSLADTDVPPPATRPDLVAGRRGLQRPVATHRNIWVVRFHRADQGWVRTRGRARDVAQWFEDGILPDPFFVGRDGDKVLKKFRAVPEFRDLARRPQKVRTVTPIVSRLMASRFGRTGLACLIALTTTLAAAALLNSVFH